MGYYQYHDCILYAAEPLPHQKLDRLPPTGEIVYLFHRPPLMGREAFAVTSPALLTAAEGAETLCSGQAGPDLPPELLEAVRQGRVRGVNAAHPRWEELLQPEKPPVKRRVHLLALGDVGSTLALGLRLMGGDVISSIGICDLRPHVADRWVFELNQIDTPQGAGFPPVEKMEPEDLFHCDVFLFCASRFVPDTAVKSGDVRMAQYELNRELAAAYGRRAREEGFQGMFCVVSDPVDPLCRAALLASNQNEGGALDFQGLFPHQVRGFGLGVMNARARYYAMREERFASFLEDGRTFGPHGEGLVVANSISRYDDSISQELTERTKHANLEMREMGFKPYAAPAMSSGALSLLLCLRGEWHCSSVFLDGIFMGVRNRLAPNGPAVEQLPLPEQLLDRIRETMEQLRAIPE
ncbi:MAG: lactate dehydrogenase [Oscillospiraceae bacterium]|nr:lactate dehydrogenase [Oscillospiraceae bacterium]